MSLADSHDICDGDSGVSQNVGTGALLASTWLGQVCSDLVLNHVLQRLYIIIYICIPSVSLSLYIFIINIGRWGE